MRQINNKTTLTTTTINNYWTRLSKISWFVSGEQINYNLAEADSWGKLLICGTLKNNDILREPSSIIVLSFGHRLVFYWISLSEWSAKRSAIFTQERSQEGGKSGFIYAWAEHYLQPKHSWTTLRMNRPLFVGSYLQVTWWDLGQWKGRIA